MDKIVRGISTFHETESHEVRPLLAHLVKEGQRPQALMITCADSRIMPEELTQADPGDLFMVRNIGNLVPSAEEAFEGTDTSVGAAIDYALGNLGVKDIVVMGHSSCGAMAALLAEDLTPGHVNTWLRHGTLAKSWNGKGFVDVAHLNDVDRLSQANVLASIEKLTSYASVKNLLESGELTLHAWWLDVANAQVLAFEPESKKFVLLQEAYAAAQPAGFQLR